MKFLFAFLLFSTSLIFANENYQMKNAVGNWSTIDGPFMYYGVAITDAGNGKTLLLNQCEKWELEMTGVCKKIFDYSGTGTYSETLDNLQVNEGTLSPTPKYFIEVDKNNPKILYRTWGNQIIEYFRTN
jgi:hypothetical protein